MTKTGQQRCPSLLTSCPRSSAIGGAGGLLHLGFPFRTQDSRAFNARHSQGTTQRASARVRRAPSTGYTGGWPLPEVTKITCLPLRTRASICSTRAPSRPSASLLSLPLVTQAVPICARQAVKVSVGLAPAAAVCVCVLQREQCEASCHCHCELGNLVQIETSSCSNRGTGHCEILRHSCARAALLATAG